MFLSSSFSWRGKTKGKREKIQPTISFKMERNHMKTDTGSCEILRNIRVSPAVSKKDLYLKLYFTLKSNFLRFSLKLKECELQQ